MNVFLSYSTIDKDIVREVADELSKNVQNNIFIDKEKINLGDNITNTLRDNLSKMDLFIYFNSINYSESPWCSYELLKAMEREKMGACKIIEIKLDGSKTHSFLADKLYLDAIGKDSLFITERISQAIDFKYSSFKKNSEMKLLISNNVGTIVLINKNIYHSPIFIFVFKHKENKAILENSFIGSIESGEGKLNQCEIVFWLRINYEFSMKKDDLSFKLQNATWEDLIQIQYFDQDANKFFIVNDSQINKF